MVPEPSLSPPDQAADAFRFMLGSREQAMVSRKLAERVMHEMRTQAVVVFTCGSLPPALISAPVIRRARFMFAEINHNARSHRFETKVDGVPCVLDYTLEDGVMTITHTIVPSAVGGRGIASHLVRTALDMAREEHWRVDPACSYSEIWMTRHPEYQDLHV
jgi:predicted GNAT family acetyltransferase